MYTLAWTFHFIATIRRHSITYIEFVAFLSCVKLPFWKLFTLHSLCGIIPYNDFPMLFCSVLCGIYFLASSYFFFPSKSDVKMGSWLILEDVSLKLKICPIPHAHCTPAITVSKEETINLIRQLHKKKYFFFIWFVASVFSYSSILKPVWH